MEKKNVEALCGLLLVWCTALTISVVIVAWMSISNRSELKELMIQLIRILGQ